MNFLAHLHLASLAESSLLGNLLADFVRGDPTEHWPEPVVAGIYMHRRLDALSDHLPQVKQARTLFREETRRVSPIALDVIWDHFLAKHWQKIHPKMSLSAFSQQAEAAIVPYLAQTPEAFQTLNAVMWKQRWFEYYQQAEHLEQVFNQMATRRPRLARLADCQEDFLANYQALELLFHDFYPNLISQALNKTL